MRSFVFRIALNLSEWIEGGDENSAALATRVVKPA
jgi:hypothetical protein